MSRSRAKQYGLVGLLALSAGLIAFANYWKSSLRVNTILVEGTRIVDKNEILQLTQIKNGSLLYDVDLMAVQKNVSAHHYVKDVTVGRNPPSTIIIDVVERTPLALVNGDQVRYLDEDGVVLPSSISKAAFDLPVVSGMPANISLSLGKRIEQGDVQEALLILSSARMVGKELYHLISEVELRSGKDIVLYSAEWGVPIIFGKGDEAAKLVRLETFWKEVVRERGSQNLQYVDLRYEDQIIVRWKQEHGLKTL